MIRPSRRPPLSPRPLRFAISVRLPSGRRDRLICSDIPTAFFFHGWPGSVPLLPCWTKETFEEQIRANRAMEAWSLAVVARGVFVEHEGVLVNLSPELVQRLGAEAERVIAAYLSGIGWLRPEDAHFVDDEVPLPAHPWRIAPNADRDRALARALVSDPERNVKAALRLVAAKAKTPPHVAWREWGISAFIWNWRILIQDTLKSRQALDGGADMLEAIGIEAEEP